MIPGLTQGGPVLVQQNTPGGGVQFILRPPTPGPPNQGNAVQGQGGKGSGGGGQPMIIAGGGQQVSEDK